MDLTDYNRRSKLDITRTDLEEEMYVIYKGKPYHGFYGYRRIALALPLLWPLAPWLYLPGIFWFGARVYGYVARNRFRFLWCDSHCKLPAQAQDESKNTTRGNPADGLIYPLTVSGIVVASLLCWFYHIEFYPLTSWHLYSHLNTSGKVEYRKVFATYESGVTSRARLEDTIGALALDNRYAAHLDTCFKDRPGDIDLCETYLSAAAAAYNKKAHPGEKVTRYEIQVWNWDFLSHPLDPDYGNLSDRFAFEINTGKVLRERSPEDLVRGGRLPLKTQRPQNNDNGM
jgi:hypothetical protein